MLTKRLARQADDPGSRIQFLDAERPPEVQIDSTRVGLALEVRWLDGAQSMIAIHQREGVAADPADCDLVMR